MNKLKLHILIFLFTCSGLQVSSQVLVDWNSSWSYFKGTIEPSASWKAVSFNPSGWPVGNAPFRYGDGTGGTLIADMPGSYSTLYLRKTFEISDITSIDEIVVSIDYDDGFVLWINGILVKAVNAPANYAYNQFAPQNHESGEWYSFTLTDNDWNFVNGTNVIAIQGFNISETSTDFFLDIAVEGNHLLPEAAPLSIDISSGFYKFLFNAKISSIITGETVKYTLDGSDPRFSSTALTGSSPVTVTIDPNSTLGGKGKTGAVILRASKFKTGYAPSKPVTRSYIFLDAVKVQSAPGGGGWPTYNVNGQYMDYPMDPNITNDVRFKDHMEEAFLDIPTLSISTDPENLFDSQSGIYVNAQYHGRTWERPANMELINPDGSPGFNIDAGLRIRGGWSRHNDFAKHAFRVYFRSEYGEGKLDFPLFENEGVDEFDKIDLRTTQNYSWSKGGGQGVHNTMNRDVFSRETQRDMNQPYTKSRYYHLYLNGMYWGIYQTQERAEAAFAESYFGGTKEDYDVIKVDIGDNWNIYEIEATDGNTDAWEEIWKMCQLGLSSNLSYFKLIGHKSNGDVDTSLTVWVDIDNLIDYMLVIFYGGNFDSPVSKFSGNYNPNNFFAIYNRTDKREGFKFLIHDSEHSLLFDAVSPGIGVNENRVNIGNTAENRMNVTSFGKFHPQWLHHKLTANHEYRIRFADRVYKHFFNGGVFDPDSCIKRFKYTSDQLNMAIIAESARWGDMGAWPARNKVDDWVPAVNKVVNNFMPVRSDIVLDQLVAENLYPTLNPPVFKRNGTIITDNTINILDSYDFTVENDNAEGSIYYTVNGTDPRAVSGTISASALNAGNLKNIVGLPGSRVKARVKNGTIWSALHEIYFADADLFSNLKVTELFYHPPDVGIVSGKELEFIELKNIGTTSLDLSGLMFTSGIQFTFPAGSTIDPQSFVIIASNQEEFLIQYGFTPDFVYAGSLANEGETITLESSTNDVIFSFTYFDDLPWPVEADGDGYSLISVYVNPKGNPDLPEYWTTSYYIFGSALADDLGSIVGIPEVLFADVDLNIYPNPASFEVNISFSLNTNENIEIGLYDLNGRLIQIIVNESFPAGRQSVNTQIGDLSLEPGIYLIRFKSESFVTTKKLVIND